MALLAGCGTTVDVDSPHPTGAAVAQCRDLLDVLPDDLDGDDRADVRPSGATAAAWGDPAVVLRCGVPRPASLQPASHCFMVSGIGWYAEMGGRPYDGMSPPSDPVTFTAINRSTYVEVTVPPDRQPAGSVLADLAEPMTRATRPGRPCV